MIDLAAIQQSLRNSASMAGCSTTSGAATSWPGGCWTWKRSRPARGGSSTSFPRRASPPSWFTGSRAAALDHLPGDKIVYLTWQELEAGVAGLVAGQAPGGHGVRPRVSNPYVSRVDAGTVELVRGCGVEIVSSGDLIQQFEATWDDDQWRMHREAEKVHDARPTTWPGA